MYRKPRTLSGSKFHPKSSIHSRNVVSNLHVTAPSQPYSPFLVSPIGNVQPRSRASQGRAYRSGTRNQSSPNKSLHLQQRKKVTKINSVSTNPIIASGGTDMHPQSNMSVHQVAHNLVDPTRANTTQMSEMDNVMSLPASALNYMPPAMNGAAGSTAAYTDLVEVESAAGRKTTCVNKGVAGNGPPDAPEDKNKIMFEQFVVSPKTS